jgi:hypothetical protein
MGVPNGKKKKSRNMEKDMKRIPALAAVLFAITLLAGSVFFQADAQEYAAPEEPVEEVEIVAEEEFSELGAEDLPAEPLSPEEIEDFGEGTDSEEAVAEEEAAEEAVLEEEMAVMEEAEEVEAPVEVPEEEAAEEMAVMEEAEEMEAEETPEAEEEEATGIVTIPVRRETAPVVTHVPVSMTPELQEAIDLYNGGKFDSALARFRDYAKRNPSPEVYWLIGYALYKLERDEEANKYFDYAYLIDPDYSPTPALEEKLDGPLDVARPGKTPAPLVEEPRERELPPPVIGGPTEEPGVTAAPTEEPVAPTEAPEETAPAGTPEETVAEPAPPVAAEEEAVPPPPSPAVEQPVEEARPAESIAPPPPLAPAPSPAPAPAPRAAPAKPFARPSSPMGEVSPTVLLVSVVGGLLLYLLYSYCFYRIARRLNVSSAWMSFVPIIQVWPFIQSAGKSGWWILLLLVPVVNLVAAILIYMSVTENLGKNKMLGLLVLVPFIAPFYPIWLAFSSSGPKQTAMPGDEDMPDLSGEPPIPDLDFELEEEEPKSPVEDEFDIPEDIEEPKAAAPADQKFAEAPDVDDFLTDNAFLEDEEEEEEASKE